MRIGLIQSSPVFGEADANASALASAIASTDADFYVLPELCLSGYDFDDRAEAERNALYPDAEPLERVARAAAERNAGVAFGFAERAPGPDGRTRVFNSARLAFPDGRRFTYRKTHLFAREKLLFDSGDTGFFVEEFRGLRVGVAVCFDWIFPESFRALALKGADLIAHCSNLVLPYCQRVDYARAIENRVYIATANRVGTEERSGRTLHFTGESVLVAPDGEYLLRLSTETPDAGVAAAHPAKARNKALGQYNDLFADRRPELYE